MDNVIYKIISNHVHTAFQELSCAKMAFHGLPEGQDLTPRQAYALLGALRGVRVSHEWIMNEAVKFAPAVIDNNSGEHV